MLEQAEVSQPVQQQVLGDVDQRGAAPGGPLGCVPGLQAGGQVGHRPAPWSSRATWLGCSGRTVSTTPQNRSVRLTVARGPNPVSYTHLRAHETGRNLVCRLLLEKKK